MRRRQFHKLDAVWLFGILVLLAAQFWFPDTGAGLSTDTWSNTARGKRAFYLLAAQQSGNIRRNHDSLESLIGQIESDYDWGIAEPVLCILGPTRNPSDQEWNRLLDWVSYGGRLVYATAAGSVPYVIPQLAISTVEKKSGELSPESSIVEMPDVATELFSSDEEYAWREEWEIAGEQIEPLLSYSGSVQVARRYWGDGTVVVISGDSIFTNQYLAFEQNSLLAWRIIEAAGGDGELIIDEYLNDSGTPKMVQILIQMPIRPMTLMLIAVICLYFWKQSHRFGPFLPESTVARRNIVDHTDMMGNLLFLSREGSYSLKLYLRQLVQELGLKKHRGRERAVLEPIARRMNVPVEQLVQLFKDSALAARSENCDVKQSASYIQKLSRVRLAFSKPVDQAMRD
ncbi:DUF4350 domain-containing protein [Planctomycetaceae bacterium]|nr:DUF4350 domain-containing protein [Planctomycetaceae bacterium]MDC0307968.1 DUF4350 domain-containing protein [Planctomycetaceae bacterium]